MELNITKIVNEKIKQLEEDGTITNQIEESIEKTVKSAIKDALESYKLKREIEEQVEQCISPIAKDLGFSAYNEFISTKIKQLINGTAKEELAEKVQILFDEMLIQKHEGIKLSEIYSQYREYIHNDSDYDERRERENFTYEISVEEDGSFTWYRGKLDKEELERYQKAEIEFSILTYGTSEEKHISSLYLDGKNVDEKFDFHSLNEIQRLFANLYFNKTNIVLDTDNIDEDDNYYNTDED